MSKFNERMRYIRKMMNLTNKEIARRIKVPESTVAYYFRDREPKYDILINIAKEFNVSINWLIGYEDQDKEALLKENEELRAKLQEISNTVSGRVWN